MQTTGEQLRRTTSFCPECLDRVPGVYERRDGAVHLTRDCPEHGRTSRAVWGSAEHWSWAAQFGPGPRTDTDGDLNVAGDHACLAVIEITQDCNLSCSYCFASSGPGGTQLDREAVIARLETVKAAGGPRPIQFSGGEPTVHDELPELVETARDMGFEHIEVNTNGIELANTDGYASRLSDAGVTAIYLQFDGLRGETYEAIRDVDLRTVKHDALQACRVAGLPVILVPTIVDGTNDHEMGDIVRFALDNTDVVRSVNFQPVAHFGRYATNRGRFSLDAAADAVAEQIESVQQRDFLPVPCCSSYCQLSTAVMPGPDGTVIPLTGVLNLDNWEDLTGLVDESDWMELLAGTAAGSDCASEVACTCGINVPGNGDVLPVTITGFMDADAGDARRLENCCISVPTPTDELVPFCGYNMTTSDGRYAIRNRHGWGGRDRVDGGLAHESVVANGGGTTTDE